MHVTSHKGILFIEGPHPDATLIRRLNVSIGGLLVQSQLKSLDDVKKRMAVDAIALGANSIVEFEYGQKSPSFLGSLFNTDDVNWHGSGVAAKIPAGTYSGLLEKGD